MSLFKKFSVLAVVAVVSAGAMAQEVAKALPAADATAKDAPAADAAAATKVDPNSYVLGAEDVLAISVWKEADVSRTVSIRPDGMISLPLVGEVKAGGITPLELQATLRHALAKYIDSPEVTVIVESAKSHKFNVVGEVAKPGSYDLTTTMTVLDAIAVAGGLKDFAKSKQIYILRKDLNGTESRLPFNYKDVIKGRHSEQNVALAPHDTVVVP
ncbi:MAG TPA: polysaccharide biosynthesis/export family protein [Terriglobales bacterium]|nr:polysaccharide biosynthesis/export family protein [Terriglobales bacterium]